MKRIYWPWLIIICVGFSGAIQAGMDIDFGANVSIGDDADLFFSISSRYFERDRASIERLAVSYRDSDDLSVALHLADRSGVRPDEVDRLRASGLSWWEVSVQLGLPADIWFVNVQKDPGPPYGKAYGYWKHHQRDRRRAFTLTDVEARDLVAVRMLHEYYGVAAEVAMQWRADGRDVKKLMTGEYRNRHTQSDQRAAAKSKGKGKPKR